MAQIGTQLGRVVERKQAEDGLRQRELQLAEAQHLTKIGSWDWDIAANRVRWSAELYQIYGLRPDEFEATYESFLGWVHPEDRPLVEQSIETAYTRRQPFDFNHRIIQPDGTVRILHAQGKVLLDEAEQPVKMLGTGQDITDRVQLEEALRQSVTLLESLFESAPDGTVLVDEQGRIERINRQMEKLFGYSRDELVGQPLEVLLPERFHEKHVENRSRYFREAHLRPMGIGLALFGRRKDGSEFPVDIMLSPLRTDQGLLVIAMVRDITGQRQAEEALRHSETRFRAIFESAALGIAVVDLQGRILASNPRLEAMLAFSSQELVGKDFTDLTHPADLETARGLYAGLLAGEHDHYQIQKRYLGKDGRVIWGNFTVSLGRDAEGRPRFAIKMIEDITARKQMEAELAEVQNRLLESREMERVQLAQELHDDPIQDLYGILYQLNDFADAISGEDRLEQFSGIRSTVQQVIHTLRAICGELRSPTLAPFGLEGAIREHVDQFQAKHPQIKVSLDLKYDGDLLPEQMRLNLFRIYQQAMNNVARHSEATHVSVLFTWDADRVDFQVEDNGRGFEVPARWIGLVRQGHLGLVGAAERAELIGGRFKVVSAPGKGTTIQVTVPRNQERLNTRNALLG
jgi:PAS domain S-box-containing protein